MSKEWVSIGGEQADRFHVGDIITINGTHPVAHPPRRMLITEVRPSPKRRTVTLTLEPAPERCATCSGVLDGEGRCPRQAGYDGRDAVQWNDLHRGMGY